ncbi:MAG: UPF0489 family protein [Aliarcobacter sp.]|jgi:hypothetical protein|nr:UPF0489 family protein [Aliarcobacter sp.]
MEILKIKNKKIYIVENHHEVLEAWEIYKNQNFNVITLDTHTDTKLCFENYCYHNTTTSNILIYNYNNNYIDIKDIITKLKNDEHIDFAVKSGIVNKVFVISYNTSYNMSNTNIFSEEPTNYNNQPIIEYDNFTTLTCEDSYIHSRTIALTPKVLNDATNYFSSLDKNYANKYILDIDLDYICTMYAFDEDLSEFKNLIKNAEIITIAKESSFVKYENETMKIEFDSKTDDEKYYKEVLDANVILEKLINIISEMK